MTTASTSTSSAAPVVRCLGVARTFGTGRGAIVAVHGATCTVMPGERIAVVGPSGSGKSTLLHLMAGLEHPTAGEVSWPAIGSFDALRPLSVGVVFQAPSLIPALDVVENVSLPLVLNGADLPYARERARGALAQLLIDDLESNLPEELSGGQAQRVAVARVLASSPRLILADEPTGQLDHENGTTVMDALLETSRQTGAALVVSTHDPQVAARLDRSWVMDDGRLAVTDDEKEVARCSP